MGICQVKTVQFPGEYPYRLADSNGVLIHLRAVAELCAKILVRMAEDPEAQDLQELDPLQEAAIVRYARCFSDGTRNGIAWGRRAVLASPEVPVARINDPEAQGSVGHCMGNNRYPKVAGAHVILGKRHLKSTRRQQPVFIRSILRRYGLGIRRHQNGCSTHRHWIRMGH